MKVDNNDLYNHRTYSDSFKDSAMEEDYTYDYMNPDEGTSTKVWSSSPFPFLPTGGAEAFGKSRI